MTRETLRSALALSLAAAVSLGIARFAYALLLPPMRADLGWSYTTAGAMNTVNAAGYLAGALLAPRWFSRYDARAVMLAGGVASALLLALHGLVRADALLYAVRLLVGVASAATFVGGGLLAARLASHGGGHTSGFVLGLYYGGTGFGIVASALLVPAFVAQAADWPAAWFALAAAALAATGATAAGTRALHAPPAARTARERVALAPLAFGLAAYLCFGLGYIGYMTFVVTLLREQGLPAGTITAFYALLRLAVLGSSWWWAPLLQRWRGGGVLALANVLLAVATALAVVGTTPAAFASGLLFGAVFLQVVAATTALVRHNLPPAAWPAGIAAFTIVFAAGQIVGPALVGWVADGAGGLERGLVVSAVLLAVGAAIATRQKARARG